ncbi:MAG: phosphopantetheine-binding protein [Planctomycetota bacterium]|jgi:sugar O-acyltransferase (sialic acid O-acetyltransferase NeuD family)
MSTLYICGAGNSEGVRLALRVNQSERRWSRILILDDDPAKHGRDLLGVEIAGSFSMLEKADPGESEVVNMVARTTDRRVAVETRLAAYGVPSATLTHPSIDCLGTTLGTGVLAFENAIVSPESVVGDSSVVFVRAVVGHEAQVGRCTVLAAGAVLNARVVLGDLVYVGSNASIVPEVTIGSGATIGANTLVIEDVPDGATVVGVPGQVIDEGAGQVSAPGPSRIDLIADSNLQPLVLSAWQDVLQQPVTEVSRNFFELGGTSLLALRLVQRINRFTSRNLQLTDVFRFPTVQAMVAHLAEDKLPTQAIETRRSSMRRERLLRMQSTRVQRGVRAPSAGSKS